MSRLKIGQPAPSVSLSTVDSKPVALADYWQKNQHLMLVFLRHLA